MTNQKQPQKLTLPIQGMSCGNCVSHVETALKKLPGVSDVSVRLEKSQASLNFDPEVLTLLDIRKAVQQAGYSVPNQETTLRVSGMSCVSCLAHVEGALQDLPGVIEVDVSLSQGKAIIQYIQEMVTIEQMEAAVRHAGYEAHVQEPHPNGSEKGEGSGGVFAWVKKTLYRPGASR